MVQTSKTATEVRTSMAAGPKPNIPCICDSTISSLCSCWRGRHVVIAMETASASAFACREAHGYYKPSAAGCSSVLIF